MSTTTTTLSAVLISALLLATGCASDAGNRSRQTTPPVTAESIETLRAAFTADDPNARLGLISEALPKEHFVRISDASPADFPSGSVVTIIDSNRAVLAHGHVEAAREGQVDIQIDEVMSGARTPAVGDVAIKFGEPMQQVQEQTQEQAPEQPAPARAQ